MPSCAFRKCNHNSRNTNKAQGVTFHSFPQDSRCREKWIKVIQQDQGDEGWLPTQFSRVCSAHFNEDEFFLTPLGRRKINNFAVPAFRPTFHHLSSDLNKRTTPSPPLCDVYVLDTDSVFDTPRNIRPKLKKQNKYLKSKNTSLRYLVKSLKYKKIFNKENFNEITQKAEEANNGFLLLLSNKKRNVPPSVKKFCATLYYYSPAAYKYLRKKCKNTLPHSITIAKWYEKRDVTPGFTQQAFVKLRTKSAQNKIIATLVVDEMAIRQRTTWNGRKTMGLVNEGLGPKDEIATQVYVFMLVSITENWKIPLGFFFINGLRAEQRANLIQMCIGKCYDVDVDIVALTFDGCSANIATAEILGCNFQDPDNLITTFTHPACRNKKIVILFDASHMLKLVRNAFESKKVIFSNGERIAWSYLVKLQKLQEKEDFKFANKLTVRHISFRNRIMKVNLSTQLLSQSVAKALILCSDMLTGNSFKDVKATVQFIKTFNNLFDVFNSTTYKKGFKRPISKENDIEIMKFLNEAEDYIKSLKIHNKVKRIRGKKIKLTINKTPVTKAKCKMGFLGFLVDIKSLKYLYIELMQKYKLINNLATYRLSQDHIELFFGLIRQHGGHNNNPTTEQFRGIYKKLLCHLELRSSFMGYCLSIDNCSILNTPSALERINATTSGFRYTDACSTINGLKSAEDEQCQINSDIMSTLLNEEKDISEVLHQIVGYISGWVVRKIVKKIQCQECSSALISNRKLSFHKLINLRNLGGLFLSSHDVFDICIKTEAFLKFHKKQQGNNYFHNEHEYIALQSKILSLFIQSNVFNNLNLHSLAQPATWNHRLLLIRSVIKYYADARLHHIHRNAKKTNRQKSTKLILFHKE